MANFLDLAPEIRELVYRHVFRGMKLRFYNPIISGHPANPRTRPPDAILFVCKKINGESRRIFLELVEQDSRTPLHDYIFQDIKWGIRKPPDTRYKFIDTEDYFTAFNQNSEGEDICSEDFDPIKTEHHGTPSSPNCLFPGPRR